MVALKRACGVYAYRMCLQEFVRMRVLAFTLWDMINHGCKRSSCNIFQFCALNCSISYRNSCKTQSVGIHAEGSFGGHQLVWAANLNVALWHYGTCTMVYWVTRNHLGLAIFENLNVIFKKSDLFDLNKIFNNLNRFFSSFQPHVHPL